MLDKISAIKGLLEVTKDSTRELEINKRAELLKQLNNVNRNIKPCYF